MSFSDDFIKKYGGGIESSRNASTSDSFISKWSDDNYIGSFTKEIERQPKKEFDINSQYKSLSLYDPVERTADEYQVDIDRLTKDRQKLNSDYNMAVANVTGKQRAGRFSKEEIKADQDKADSLKAQLADMDRQIKELKKGKWRAENSAKYINISSNADFDEKSKIIDENKAKGLFFDDTYAFINDINNRRERGQYQREGNADPDAELQKYTFMTQQEKDTYNYLYQTEGKKSAKEYLDYIGYDLDSRKQQKYARDNAEFATNHHIIASVASVPANLISGVGLLDVAYQNAVRNITGEYKPINYNTNMMNPTNFTTAVRGTVSQNLADEYGSINLSEDDHPVLARFMNGKSLGDVYQLGMSMVDSGATAAIGSITGIGAAGTALLGGSAGSQGVLTALEKGATDEQALAMGLLNGTFEALFEYVSMDKLLNGNTKSILKTFLEQGFVEGTEEFNTTLFNTLADICVMAENSDYKRSVQAYMNQGLSQKDAEIRAMQDIAIGMGWDFIGGAISGGIMGGGKSVINQNILEPHYYSKVYGTDLENLVSESLKTDPDNKFAQEIQKKLDNSKKVKGKEIRSFVTDLRTRDVETIRSAVEKQLTTYGETGDVTAISKAIAKQASGEELTAAEERIISSSKYGQRVVNELNPENIRSQRYNTDWSEKIGTKVINPIEYDKISVMKSEQAEYEQFVEDYTKNHTPIEPKKVEEPTTAETKMTGNATVDAVIKKASGKELSGNDVRPILNDKEAITALESAVGNLNLNGKSSSEQRAIVRDAITKYASENKTTANVSANQKTAENGIEAVATKYGKQAGAVRSIYNISPVENVDSFATAFETAYQIGLNGGYESAAVENSLTQVMSEAQRRLAYATGKAVRAARSIDGVKRTSNGKGTVRARGMSVSDINKRFKHGSNQKTALQVLRAIAEATGFTIELFDSAGDYSMEQGSFDWGTDVIAIDIASGIFQDADVETLAKYAMLRTFCHEFTHTGEKWAAEEYNILRTAVIEALSSREEFDLDYRINEIIQSDYESKKAKYIADGMEETEAADKAEKEKLSWDMASREVVAEAMTDVLPESRFIKSLYEKDATLANKIKDALHKFLARVKAYFNELVSNPSREAQALKVEVNGAVKYLEGIVDKWDAMALAAVENYQNSAVDETLNNAGIIVDNNTDSASISQNSVRYLLDDKNKSKVVKALSDRFGVTKEEAGKWLTAETSIASLVLNPKYSMYLDYEADPDEVAIKTNSDYPQGTVDFSPICKKRREFTAVMNSVFRQFPNHVFAATDLAKIRTIMGEEGMTLPCGICYVEDRRQLDSIVAQDFLNGLKLYREGSTKRPDGKPFNANQLKGLRLTDGISYTPSIYELVSLEGRNKLKKEHPEMEAAWVKYNNARGMQAVRLLSNEAEYKRQILDYNKRTVKSKNDNGGLRIYSFSDAEMFHLIDIIQIITDSSAVGLSIQGYTKVNEYAKAVRNTGEKLNRSLIPLGDLGYHMENGKVVLDFDTVEGIDINSPDFFDNSDNPDIGNIVIGINDTQIRAAMVSPFIDQIIPFHTSQSEEVLEEKGINKWDNYKDYQTEKDISTGKTSEHQINIYTEVIQVLEAEGKTINKRTFVEKFLQVCKENGLTPRFAQFLNTDENGDYVYTEGYHKMLVDFKTFAQTEVGEYLPQMPVKPIFDDAYLGEILKAYVDEQKKKDASVAESMPKVVDRISNEIIKPSEQEIKKQYLKRVTDPYMLKKLNQAEREGVRDFKDIKEGDQNGVVKVYRAMQAQPVDENGKVIPNASVQRIVSYDPLIVEAKVFTGTGRKKKSEIITAPAKLFSPMAGAVNGVWRNPINLNEWEMSEGHLERATTQIDDKTGLPKIDTNKNNASYGEVAYYFGLEKGGVDDNGKPLTDVPARYNPYVHTSLSALNDQFSSGEKRPELVTVESLVPVFHINNGMNNERLPGAKDRVGAMSWHSGPTSSRLAKVGKARVVILSRYDKPIRVVPDSEVAASIANTIGDSENIAIQGSTVTPSLQKELKALGVSVLNAEDWAKYAEEYPVKAFGQVSKKQYQSRDVQSIPFSEYEKMENHFGTTKNYDVAGYLLIDGEMLDFSGKHWGDPTSTSRQVDHRDIQEVLDGRGNNGVNAMIDMIGNRNIRLMPETGGINLSHAPNGYQEKVLRGYINHFRGEIIVDVDEVGGDTIDSFRYNRGTSSEKILNDIRNYFNKGIKPEKQSDVMQFHKQYSNREYDKFTQLQARNVNGMTYYSGGGLVDYALRAQLDHQMAVEIDEPTAEVYKLNNGDNIFVGDVRDFDVDSIDGDVPYFHASPVCKTYSKAISKDAKAKRIESEIDILTAQATADAIRKLQKKGNKIVTIENVKEYRGSDALKIITDALDECGYKWDKDMPVYNSADFGAATSRERLLIRAVKGGELPAKPVPTHSKGNYVGWYSVTSDLIDGLDEVNLPNWLLGKLNEIGIDPNNVSKPLYVAGDAPGATGIPHAYADKPVPTITANTHLPFVIMPDGRVLQVSPRMIARLQGLPDSYQLPTDNSGRTLKGLSKKIVGNGVPVQLTQAVFGPVLDANFDESGKPLTMQMVPSKQYQKRTQSYTDREVLERAADIVDLKKLTPGERDALNIFGKRLGQLKDLQNQRDEQRRILAEQKSADTPDEAEIRKTTNRLIILGKKIKTAENLVLSVEDKQVLKKVLKESRKIVERDQRGILKDRSDVDKYRTRVADKVQKLSEKLLKNSDKEHIPQALKGPLAEFLTTIDFSSKRKLRGGDPTKKDLKYTETLDRVRQVLQGQLDYMNNPDNGSNLDFYLDMPQGFVDAIQSHINKVNAAMNGFDSSTNQVNLMNKEQLQDLDFILTVISHSVNNINKLHTEGRFAGIAEAARDTILELVGRKPDSGKAAGARGFFEWKNALPVYAFKRYGEAGKTIFEGLQNGWDKLAFNSNELKKFSEKAYTAKEVNDWSNHLHTITLDSGKTVKMTTAQIMSLYCLNNREQARGHLYGGGMRVGNIEIKEGKTGLKKTPINQTDPFLLSIADVTKILSELNQRQIEVAKSLQKYMSTVGSAWGNAVSMERFGYNSFEEKNYFPIESDKTNLPAIDPDAKANDMFRLLNLSMTKSLTPNANNALVVSNIFDVFATHMSDMAKYNALALPILDAMKWFNYKESDKNPATGQVKTQTVQRSIERAFGKEGGSYYLNLMKDLNGANNGGRDEGILNGMMSSYKVAAVAANLRVALLQPTAYFRASAVLSPKVMAKAVTMKGGVEKMLKYSGIAVWKDLGFFDTNIGRPVTSIVKHDDTIKDKIVEKSLYLAELGDKVTWGIIWNACELDQRMKGVKQEDLMEATAKRFRDVIYQTQVVDSTLTRTQLMRDKSVFIKNITGFMSEPSLSYNLLLDTYEDLSKDAGIRGWGAAWKKNGNRVYVALGAYAASQLAAAIAESIADAFRDDDDYETFLEKWLEAFWADDDGKWWEGNLVSDLSVLRKMPIIKDVIGSVGGYESTNMTMQWLEDLMDLKNVLTSDKRTMYGKIYKMLQTVSRITGLPMSNAMREVATIWNNTIGVLTGNKLTTYSGGVKADIKEAYAAGHLTEEEAISKLIEKGAAEDENEAYWIVNGFDGDSKYTHLKDAIHADDQNAFNEAMDELTSNGVDEKTAKSHAKTVIGDLYKGTDKEPASISKTDAVKMLIDYAGLNREDAQVTASQWQCKVDNGFDYGEIRDRYDSGSISYSNAVSYLKKYGGKSDDKAVETVDKWKFIGGNEKYEDISASAVSKYNELCAPAGISKAEYFDAWKVLKDMTGEDKDGDGKTDAYSKMNKQFAYIDSLNLTSEQKTALALAFGIKETSISKRAPW